MSNSARPGASKRALARRVAPSGALPPFSLRSATRASAFPRKRIAAPIASRDSPALQELVTSR
jgi:hypothetical protein